MAQICQINFNNHSFFASSKGTWHLSESGNDTLPCGLSENDPCSTLLWILNIIATQNGTGAVHIKTQRSLHMDDAIMVNMVLILCKLYIRDTLLYCIYVVYYFTMLCQNTSFNK